MHAVWSCCLSRWPSYCSYTTDRTAKIARVFERREYVCAVKQGVEDRFGRGGIIDDVLLTSRDDFDGEPFLPQALTSLGSAGYFVSPTGGVVGGPFLFKEEK